MDFSSEHYYRASIQRMRQAKELYHTRDNFALTMYVSGVAVESMLRAFLVKKKTEFDSRHDVLLLLKESGMLEVDPDILKRKGLSDEGIIKHRRTLHLAVSTVFGLWRNDYRYASEARLLVHLKRRKLYRKAKGDQLKANALQLLEAAELFVDKGIVQWH